MACFGSWPGEIRSAVVGCLDTSVEVWTDAADKTPGAAKAAPAGVELDTSRTGSVVGNDVVAEATDEAADRCEVDGIDETAGVLKFVNPVDF